MKKMTRPFGEAANKYVPQANYLLETIIGKGIRINFYGDGESFRRARPETNHEIMMGRIPIARIRTTKNNQPLNVLVTDRKFLEGIKEVYRELEKILGVKAEIRED